MKIWELHGMRLEGAITTAPGGDADVAGLLLSEKAYLLAMRDYRPEQLVRLVHAEGAETVAERLAGHFCSGAGHSLVSTRGLGAQPKLLRSDEVPKAPMFAGRRR